MPVTAMAAAHAMLGEPELVAARKRGNAERRADVMASSRRTASRYTPSVSNKLMVDARMPDAAGDRRPEGARTSTSAAPWPVWPTHVRVTIGSADDMARFKGAFLEVTANGSGRG